MMYYRCIYYVFSILGMRLLNGNTDMTEARCFSNNNDIIDIYSNSWGPARMGEDIGQPEMMTKMVFENAVKQVSTQLIFV